MQDNTKAPDENYWKNHKMLCVLWEVFDFFCGDWTIFFGVAATIILTVLITKLQFLSFLMPVIGIIYICGISISFLKALISKQKSV
jgi:hypothetical protein